MPVIEMFGDTQGVPLHFVGVRSETFRNSLLKEETRGILLWYYVFVLLPMKFFYELDELSDFNHYCIFFV